MPPRSIYIYDISLSHSQNAKVVRKNLNRKTKRAFYGQQFFFNHTVYEMDQRSIELDRPHTHTHTHTHTIFNTYCFSMATMVTRTRLNVYVTVHWLSCRIYLTQMMIKEEALPRKKDAHFLNWLFPIPGPRCSLDAATKRNVGLHPRLGIEQRSSKPYSS